MSDIGKTALKTKIDNKVYENSSQAITGTIMNEVLQDVVDTLADGGNLDAGSVDTANIKDGAVTDGKLDTGVLNKVDWATASQSYYRNSQAGNVAAKTLTTYTDGYVMRGGGSLKVTFENANTADNATLNIDGKGAKPLYYNGVRVSSTNSWAAGETVEIYYNNYNSGIFYAKKWQTDVVSVSQNTLSIGGEEKGVLMEKVTNPEWVQVVTDSNDKVLYGVKTDGKFYFGDGWPPQVVDYIQKKIDELSLDEYESIVTFLGDLIDGDTLATLLNAKVDKVTGKSLIDEDFAEAIDYQVESPEFISVVTDSEDKVLEGIQVDGTKVFGADVKIGGNAEIGGVSYKIIESPEWVKAIVDAEDKVLCGIKYDGKFYADIAGVSSEVQAFKSIFSILENPEFIQITTDADGKILQSRNPEGVNKEYVGFETPSVSIDGATIENIQDTEGRTEVKTDAEDKILSYRDSQGVVHENVGIETNMITLSEEGRSSLYQGFKKDGLLSGYHSPNLPKYGTVNIKQETFYLTYNANVSGASDVYVIQDLADTDANAAAKLTIAFYYIKSSLVDNGDGTYSKYNDGVEGHDVKLNFYAASKVATVNSIPYVTSSLTEIVDPITGDISYEVNANSIRVVQIVDVPDVRTWPVDKKTEHFCLVDIDFGHYYAKNNIAIGIKFQGSSTLNYRERNFRFTFYKNATYTKKDKIKIGEMLRLSGFNLKANWTDTTKIRELILNRLILAVWQQRDVYDQYPWYKDYTPYCGATGTIKGFPVQVSVDGKFYGIDIFGLKKDEKNYMLSKAEMDGETYIDATGMFVSGTGGVWRDNAFQDGWQNYPEYWEDEMNDDEFLTENGNTHTPSDSAALSSWLTFINSSDFKKSNIPSRLDVIGFIDYFILMQTFVMYDNTTRNVVLYSDNSRQKLYPFFYDLDLCWNVENSRTTIDADVLAPGISTCADVSIWENFWSEYKDEIINRYCQLRNSVLSVEYLLSIYKDVIANIPDEDIKNQMSRWGNPVTTKDMGIYFRWLDSRLNWLDENYFKV